MAYMIANIEACEPTMLRVDPEVEVVAAAGMRTMCPLVSLICDDRQHLAAYLKDQWGDDEATGGWTSEVIAEIEEVEREGPRPFGIFWDPDCTRRIATVEARTAIEALDVYSVGQGFARYSDLIAEGIDGGHGSEWLSYTEDVHLGGPFTNHEVFAAEVNS